MKRHLDRVGRAQTQGENRDAPGHRGAAVIPQQSPDTSQHGRGGEGKQDSADESEIHQEAQVRIVVDIPSNGLHTYIGCSIIQIGAIVHLELVESVPDQGPILEHFPRNVGECASHFGAFEGFGGGVFSFEGEKVRSGDERGQHRAEHQSSHGCDSCFSVQHGQQQDDEDGDGCHPDAPGVGHCDRQRKEGRQYARDDPCADILRSLPDEKGPQGCQASAQTHPQPDGIEHRASRSSKVDSYLGVADETREYQVPLFGNLEDRDGAEVRPE